jgi:peptidoglycan/xylan/chitin deacetylase (PgdA/CDA1 family)
MLNWQQVTRMIQEGMEIGSHTLTHADLDRVPPDRVRSEIEGSKRKLEQELGLRVTSFCYPSGRFTAETASMVRDSGYLSACTTKIGIWNGHDLFSIPRIPVMSSDVFMVFKQKMTGRLGGLRHIH